MESRSGPRGRRRSVELSVRDPEGVLVRKLELTGERLTVGRLEEANDLALGPDPQQLVGRTSHCTLERDGSRWVVVDGGSVNGTLVRRNGELLFVTGRVVLDDGDVVCILGLVTDAGDRRYFELAISSIRDPEATRAAPVPDRSPEETSACIEYDRAESRLLLVRDAERTELRVRAQAHRLASYMVERNDAAGGVPALCTHDELMDAVWGDEPMHTREELARLVWELRRTLEPFDVSGLLETEPRRGYRLHSCPRSGRLSGDNRR